MIIDTHCHPQLKQYDADREQVIRRALQADITMICVGVDLETSRQAITLAEQYEGVWASVGLHPNDNLDEVYDQGAYEELATHAKVVAIGEVGLDYYRTTEPAKQMFQKDRLIQQLSLAAHLNKPVIIHCRDAHEDMLGMLTTKNRGVIHSFTGTIEQAQAYIDRGFHIGLNGIVTFADYDKVVQQIPLDSLLLETDSPYLAPKAYRGKRNEPVYILETAKRIAELKGVPLDELIQVTTKNANNLFSI